MRTVGMIVKEKKRPGKKEIMELLTEKGIDFDEKAKLEELLRLLPKE